MHRQTITGHPVGKPTHIQSTCREYRPVIGPYWSITRGTITTLSLLQLHQYDNVTVEQFVGITCSQVDCRWVGLPARCPAAGMTIDALCYKCVKLAVKLRQRLWSRGSPQPPFGRGTRSWLYGKLETEIVSGNKLDCSLSTSASIFLIFDSTASHDFPFLECMPPLHRLQVTV